MTNKQGEAVAQKTARHTPGPWTIGEDGDVFADDCACVAMICGAADGIIEAQANAHLIAAAPELLAAATRVVEHLSKMENGKWLNNAAGEELKAAIAKAREAK